jgi:hypothetical protein
MPVAETAEPVPIPSGEVAPMEGVGLAIPLTCAMAALQMRSAGMTAATSENRIGVLGLPAALPQRAPMSISFATIPPGARLLDIGQFLSRGALSFGIVCRGSTFLFRAVSSFVRVASYVWFPICSGRWSDRVSCSIKYEFMLLAPISFGLSANPIF